MPWNTGDMHTTQNIKVYYETNKRATCSISR